MNKNFPQSKFCQVVDNDGDIVVYPLTCKQLLQVGQVVKYKCGSTSYYGVIVGVRYVSKMTAYNTTMKEGMNYLISSCCVDDLSNISYYNAANLDEFNKSQEYLDPDEFHVQPSADKSRAESDDSTDINDSFYSMSF